MCASIFFKDIEWNLGVIGRLQNDYWIIFIFTGEVINGTPNIFTSSQYHCRYKELRDQRSPVIINTTHENVHISNQLKGEIPRSGSIYQKQQIINTYTVSVLKMFQIVFEKLRIKD